LVNFGPLFYSTNFRQRISRTLFVIMQQKWAVLEVWPIDTYFPNLVNFGGRSRDTIWRHASVMHLFYAVVCNMNISW